MTTRSHLLAAGTAVLALAGAAVPAAHAASGPGFRDYDVKLSVSMTSTFSFDVDPTGCNGIKPSGYIGSGQEILEASSPRPVRVTIYAFPGQDVGMSPKRWSGGFPLEGVTKRTGSMRFHVCDADPPIRFDACTGRHRFSTKVNFAFGAGNTFSVSDTMNQTTRNVVPPCDDSAFDWDGAVARTGVVLLDDATGSAEKARKTKSGFTLRAGSTETCDVQYFGTGTCGTTWRWTAKFTPVTGKKKRKRR